ncbi:hypothetical protein BaRGS_00017729 [Batillaria attramentaria]|uniref:Uncharacterized protein n=1 Tax=Batillaria attramentaria TaxID=370345 RepID=A0ABD0KUS2_9CAEN
MKPTYGVVVFLAVANIQVTSALQWTSALDLPANVTVHACTGDNVTLPWKYETEGAEHAIDVEWLYQAEGQVEELIASNVRGNFFVTPTAKQHLQFVPNAGLELMHVTQADSGAYILNVNINLHGSVTVYSQRVVLEVSNFEKEINFSGSPDVYVTGAPANTDGQLHVQLMPSAVQDNVTGEWHVMLSCGTFSSLGQPPVSVLWTTPDNVTVSSSYYGNAGSYILIIDNPVATGEYSCRLEQTPSAMCLPAQSLLHNGASIHVDGVETRLSVLEGQLVALQNENAELRSELGEQRKENENTTAVLEGRLTAMQQENTVLKSNLRNVTEKVSEITHYILNKSALDVCDSMTGRHNLNNQPFSTYDHDNDAYSGVNCASQHHGAWWYNYCTWSNLNGLYTHNSNDRDWKYVVWHEWNHDARSFKRAEMKIRLRA